MMHTKHQINTRTAMTTSIRILTASFSRLSVASVMYGFGTSSCVHDTARHCLVTLHAHALLSAAVPRSCSAIDGKHQAHLFTLTGE